jgi:quinohemoprotein ethanol dehydrogenase
VFALNGKLTLPDHASMEAPIPAPTTVVKVSPNELAEGGSLYNVYCGRCHAPSTITVKSGAIPDLRRSTAETHAMFEAIVRGGARRVLGMPSFAEDITADQARLIQAFVLDQARRASATKKP